jgi:hypothetical protein
MNINFKRFNLLENIKENKALSISVGGILLTLIVLGFMGYLDNLISGILAFIVVLLLGLFGALATLIPVILGLGLYCLPTIVSLVRGHANKSPIILVNLLLGWTLIGWAIALIWAFTDNAEE